MATPDAPSPPLYGDQRRGNVVLVTRVVMTSIAVTLVFLRCYQMKVLKAIKVDDICIILGMVIDPDNFSSLRLSALNALDFWNRLNVNGGRHSS